MYMCTYIELYNLYLSHILNSLIHFYSFIDSFMFMTLRIVAFVDTNTLDIEKLCCRSCNRVIVERFT